MSWLTYELESPKQLCLGCSKTELEGDIYRVYRMGLRIKHEKDTGFSPGDPQKGGTTTSQGQSSTFL